MKSASFEGSMNGGKFVDFVQKLRRDVNGPRIAIADNAPIIAAPPVQAYVTQSQGELVVEHLLRYAPELNPDEQLWNLAKLRLGKLIPTRQKMKAAVSSIMRSIHRQTTLIQSFFQLPDTKYAAR